MDDLNSVIRDEIEDSDDEYTGKTIEGYTVEEKLGSGGIGDVYVGVKDDKKYALKFIKEKKPEFISALKNEARIQSNIDDPGLLKVYDFIEDAYFDQNGGEVKPMMVLEYEDGMKALDVSTVRSYDIPDITMQVLDTLERLHDRGVVHCDIKPGNILLTKDGKVKIADCGFAKIFVKHGDLANTVWQTFAPSENGNVGGGTHGYLPGNCAEELADPKPSLDIFEFGVVLYQMIMGSDKEFPGMGSLPSLDGACDKKLQLSNFGQNFISSMLIQNRERRDQTISKIKHSGTEGEHSMGYDALLKAYNRPVSWHMVKEEVVDPACRSRAVSRNAYGIVTQIREEHAVLDLDRWLRNNLGIPEDKELNSESLVKHREKLITLADRVERHKIRNKDDARILAELIAFNLEETAEPEEEERIQKGIEEIKELSEKYEFSVDNMLTRIDNLTILPHVAERDAVREKEYERLIKDIDEMNHEELNKASVRLKSSAYASGLRLDQINSLIEYNDSRWKELHLEQTKGLYTRIKEHFQLYWNELLLDTASSGAGGIAVGGIYSLLSGLIAGKVSPSMAVGVGVGSALGRLVQKLYTNHYPKIKLTPEQKEGLKKQKERAARTKAEELTEDIIKNLENYTRKEIHKILKQVKKLGKKTDVSDLVKDTVLKKADYFCHVYMREKPEMLDALEYLIAYHTARTFAEKYDIDVSDMIDKAIDERIEYLSKSFLEEPDRLPPITANKLLDIVHIAEHSDRNVKSLVDELAEKRVEKCLDYMKNNYLKHDRDIGRECADAIDEIVQLHKFTGRFSEALEKGAHYLEVNSRRTHNNYNIGRLRDLAVRDIVGVLNEKYPTAMKAEEPKETTPKQEMPPSVEETKPVEVEKPAEDPVKPKEPEVIPEPKPPEPEPVQETYQEPEEEEEETEERRMLE